MGEKAEEQAKVPLRDRLLFVLGVAFVRLFCWRASGCWGLLALALLAGACLEFALEAVHGLAGMTPFSGRGPVQ
jgi:hypothetical protein